MRAWLPLTLLLLAAPPALAGAADDIRNAEKMLIGYEKLQRDRPLPDLAALTAKLEAAEGPRSLFWPHAVALAGWLEESDQKGILRDVANAGASPMEARAAFERSVFDEVCYERDRRTVGWKTLPHEAGDARLEALAIDLATRVGDPGALPLDVHLRAAADAYLVWAACIRPHRPKDEHAFDREPWRAVERAARRDLLRREIRKQKGAYLPDIERAVIEQWPSVRDGLDRSTFPLPRLSDNEDIQDAFVAGLVRAIAGRNEPTGVDWDEEDPAQFYVGFERNVAAAKAWAAENRRIEAIPRPGTVGEMVQLERLLDGRVLPVVGGNDGAVMVDYFGAALRDYRSAADARGLSRASAVLAWLAELDAGAARPVVSGIYAGRGYFRCGVHEEVAEKPEGRPRLTLSTTTRDRSEDVRVVERTERQVIASYREVVVAGNAGDPPYAPSGLDPVTRLNRILALQRMGRDNQSSIWRAESALGEARSLSGSGSTDARIRREAVAGAQSEYDAALSRYDAGASELEQLEAEHRAYERWAAAAAPSVQYVPVYGVEVTEKRRYTLRYVLDVEAVLDWKGQTRTATFTHEHVDEFTDDERAVPWEETADDVLCEATRRVGLGEVARHGLADRIDAMGPPPAGPEALAAAFARAPSVDTLRAFLDAMEKVIAK